MDFASAPTHKYDNYLDFDIDAVASTDHPVFSKQEEELLDIIYQREPVKVQQEDTGKAAFHTPEPSTSIITKVVSELDKLNNRLFIIGLLVSMIVSIMAYKLLQKLGGKKTVPAVPNTTTPAKNTRKNK
jgi:hypothetical protein